MVEWIQVRDMIRLVASDMDGTYVAYDGTVSEANMNAVRRMNAEGIVFAAASGRNHEGIMRLFKPYGLEVECICANGAQYIDIHGNLVSSAYLPLEKSLKIIDVFQKHHVHFMFFAAEGIYCYEDAEKEIRAYADRVRRRFGEQTELAGTVSSMKQVQDISEIHVMKIEGYDMDEELLTAVRQDMLQIEGINALSAAVDNLEVTDELASKGKILEDVCRRKGISKDEALVLGDGLNDITLFELFPHSAAIGNSAEPLKKLAEIIDPDDHEGFAHVVNAALDRKI